MENKKQLVRVEYNIAKAFSLETLKLALHMFLSMFLLILLFIVIGSLLIFNNLTISIIMNLAFLSICFYFYLNSGLIKGQKDAALSEIVFKRLMQKEQVSQAEQNKCYNKFKGLFAVIIGILPFFIMLAIFSFYTKIQYYTLNSLPAWLNEYVYQADLSIALGYYLAPQSINFENILRIASRACIMPFVSAFNSCGNYTMYIIEKLSPLLVWFVPIGYAIGYEKGKKHRIMINKAIKTNAKRSTILNSMKNKKEPKEQKRII